MLHAWRSFLNRFAEVASCPECCPAQLSNVGLRHAPESQSADPGALEVLGGERAPRTVWLYKAACITKISGLGRCSSSVLLGSPVWSGPSPLL